MLEPLAVTVHAARRGGGRSGQEGMRAGCGPIGILLVQSLKAFGAAEVMATDISDYRLELARTCGADYAVNTKTRPLWRGSDGVLRPRQGGHHLRLRGQ